MQKTMSGNDFMYLAVSAIANRNYVNYFDTWGIEVSQAALDQITANGIVTQVPAEFYFIGGNLPVAMPSATLPLDGTTAYADPG